MSNDPRVTVVLYTYEDGERHTAEITLRSTLDNIYYSGPLHVIIADDGSIDGHVDTLFEVAGGYPHVATVGITNAQRGGYGRSYNLASQASHPHGGYVLPLEDDWRLEGPLDLDAVVAAMEATGVACMRLGYIGHTQELRGVLRHSPIGQVLVFDPDSAERHVFAGHPRLETIEFQRSVGPWPEGIPAGMTEFDVSGRPEARAGVGFPLDLIHPRGDLFAHIGAHELGELQP
jgi:hypothetical protein